MAISHSLLIGGVCDSVLQRTAGSASLQSPSDSSARLGKAFSSYLMYSPPLLCTAAPILILQNPTLVQSVVNKTIQYAGFLPVLPVHGILRSQSNGDLLLA